jgi:hypothetical protein
MPNRPQAGAGELGDLPSAPGHACSPHHAVAAWSRPPRDEHAAGIITRREDRRYPVGYRRMSISERVRGKRHSHVVRAARAIAGPTTSLSGATRNLVRDDLDSDGPDRDHC